MKKNLTPLQKRTEILRLLNRLTDHNRDIFRRLYAKGDQSIPLEEIVKNIKNSNLDIALRQCRTTYYQFFERMKK